MIQKAPSYAALMSKFDDKNYMSLPFIVILPHMRVYSSCRMQTFYTIGIKARSGPKYKKYPHYIKFV